MDTQFTFLTIYPTSIGSSSFFKCQKLLLPKRITIQLQKTKALPKFIAKNKAQFLIKFNSKPKKDVKNAIVEDKETVKEDLGSEFNREQLQRTYLKSDAYEGIDITEVHRLKKKGKSTTFDFIREIKSKFNFKINGRIQGLLLLNLMTLIMSTNYTIVKDVQGTIDPYTFSALRFIAASLALLPFLNTAFKDKRLLAAATEVGMYGGLGYLTQGIGLMTTDASRCSFLSALTVVLVPILVGLSGRGVSKITWISVTVAMIGVAMLEGIGFNGVSDIASSSSIVGDTFNLISAAFFALQIFRTEHYAHTVIKNRKFAFLAAAITTTALSSVALDGIAHIPELRHIIASIPDLTFNAISDMATSFTHLPFTQIIYTGVFSTDGILLIELIALKNVISTDAAIIYTMEPVLGALWAYLFLGERWGLNGWLGASLILFSSLATQLYGSTPESSKPLPSTSSSSMTNQKT